MQVIIPSRRRVGSCSRALALFPEAVVCVAESEVGEYERLPAELLVHPDSVAGIGPLRQWVLDHVAEETVVMVDDDVYEVRTVAGHVRQSHVIRDPAAVAQVLENAEALARGWRTPVFGFDQSGGDVRKFRPQDPLGLNSWAGGVIGVIGRELRYDPTLLLRADIDFCLKALLKFRVVCIDRRFAFVHRRFKNKGGNDHMRSGERNRLEIERLRARWGRWLGVIETKTTTRLAVRVKRRQ